MFRSAFTLVELLSVVVIMGLLALLTAGTLGQAKRQARLAACASQQRSIHIALSGYASAHANCMPPFALSEAASASLPLSTHWGGISQPADPAGAWRLGVQSVNLWSLVIESLLPARALNCPAADLEEHTESGFAHTLRHSTYSLRLPYSADLYRQAQPLLNTYGLLGSYRRAAGGQVLPLMQNVYRVPLVRVDWTYASAGGQHHEANMLEDAWVADGFWRRDHRRPAPQTPGLTGYAQRADWWHGERFNVLYGSGVVRAVDDDGTVAANTCQGDAAPPDDGQHHATYAEQVWRFFDLRK